MLAKRPDRVRVHFSLGRVLSSVGQPVEVESEFRKDVDIKSDATGHFVLAQAQLEEALAECLRALRPDPNLTVAGSN